MSWQNIRGHDHQVRSFERVYRRGRLAHAYLFVGTPGIGKHLFARELGKTLLCDNMSADRFEACDRCSACAQVKAGSHPDFLTATRPEESLEFPIAVMQELCGGFRLKSATGKGRIAILDQVDDLNEESANCFLKTLEEPPPRSVLILVGSTAERQLTTIVSRCQVVRFAPLQDADLLAVLQEHGIEDAALRQRLARLSGGSPGQALDLAEPELWEFRNSFFAGLLAPRIDCMASAKQWSEFVEKAGKESGVRRRRAAQVLQLLVQLLRDALALHTGAVPQENDPAILRALTQMREQISVEQLLELLERCLEADVHLHRRVQIDLTLEALTDFWGKTIASARSRG